MLHAWIFVTYGRIYLISLNMLWQIAFTYIDSCSDWLDKFTLVCCCQFISVWVSWCNCIDSEADSIKSSIRRVVDMNPGMYEYFNPMFPHEPHGASNFSWTAALFIDLFCTNQTHIISILYLCPVRTPKLFWKAWTLSQSRLFPIYFVR